VSVLKRLPLGVCWLIEPFVFSFVSRCQLLLINSTPDLRSTSVTNAPFVGVTNYGFSLPVPNMFSCFNSCAALLELARQMVVHALVDGFVADA